MMVEEWEVGSSYPYDTGTILRAAGKYIIRPPSSKNSTGEYQNAVVIVSSSSNVLYPKVEANSDQSFSENKDSSSASSEFWSPKSSLFSTQTPATNNVRKMFAMRQVRTHGRQGASRSSSRATVGDSSESLPYVNSQHLPLEGINSRPMSKQGSKSSRDVICKANQQILNPAESHKHLLHDDEFYRSSSTQSCVRNRDNSLSAWSGIDDNSNDSISEYGASGVGLDGHGLSVSETSSALDVTDITQPDTAATTSTESSDSSSSNSSSTETLDNSNEIVTVKRVSTPDLQCLIPDDFADTEFRLRISSDKTKMTQISSSENLKGINVEGYFGPNRSSIFPSTEMQLPLESSKSDSVMYCMRSQMFDNVSLSSTMSGSKYYQMASSAPALQQQDHNIEVSQYIKPNETFPSYSDSIMSGPQSYELPCSSSVNSSSASHNSGTITSEGFSSFVYQTHTEDFRREGISNPDKLEKKSNDSSDNYLGKFKSYSSECITENYDEVGLVSVEHHPEVKITGNSLEGLLDNKVLTNKVEIYSESNSSKNDFSEDDSTSEQRSKFSKQTMNGDSPVEPNQEEFILGVDNPNFQLEFCTNRNQRRWNSVSSLGHDGSSMMIHKGASLNFNLPASNSLVEPPKSFASTFNSDDKSTIDTIGGVPLDHQNLFPKRTGCPAHVPSLSTAAGNVHNLYSGFDYNTYRYNSLPYSRTSSSIFTAGLNPNQPKDLPSKQMPDLIAMTKLLREISCSGAGADIRSVSRNTGPVHGQAYKQHLANVDALQGAHPAMSRIYPSGPESTSNTMNKSLAQTSSSSFQQESTKVTSSNFQQSHSISSIYFASKSNENKDSKIDLSAQHNLVPKTDSVLYENQNPYDNKRPSQIEIPSRHSKEENIAALLSEVISKGDILHPDDLKWLYEGTSLSNEQNKPSPHYYSNTNLLTSSNQKTNDGSSLLLSNPNSMRRNSGVVAGNIDGYVTTNFSGIPTYPSLIKRMNSTAQYGYHFAPPDRNIKMVSACSMQYLPTQPPFVGEPFNSYFNYSNETNEKANSSLSFQKLVMNLEKGNDKSDSYRYQSMKNIAINNNKEFRKYIGPNRQNDQVIRTSKTSPANIDPNIILRSSQTLNIQTGTHSTKREEPYLYHPPSSNTQTQIMSHIFPCKVHPSNSMVLSASLDSASSDSYSSPSSSVFSSNTSVNSKSNDVHSKTKSLDRKSNKSDTKNAEKTLDSTKRRLNTTRNLPPSLRASFHYVNNSSSSSKSQPTTLPPELPPKGIQNNPIINRKQLPPKNQVYSSKSAPARQVNSSHYSQGAISTYSTETSMRAVSTGSEQNAAPYVRPHEITYVAGVPYYQAPLSCSVHVENPYVDQDYVNDIHLEEGVPPPPPPPFVKLKRYDWSMQQQSTQQQQLSDNSVQETKKSSVLQT